MVKAYILIEVTAGHSGELVRRLKGNVKVQSVSRVTGPYDVIAIVEDDDLNMVHNFVTSVIHGEEGVLRTTTSVSVDL